MTVGFDAEFWIWAARRDDSWTFVSLPAEASEEIHELTGGRHRGFGSVRIRTTVGTNTWRHRFPDAASAGISLTRVSGPVKLLATAIATCAE
jgi:hypothetical protein